jgi:hypothetical protein
MVRSLIQRTGHDKSLPLLAEKISGGMGYGGVGVDAHDL